MEEMTVTRPEQQELPLAPGDMLRRARQRLNLSVESIAEQMRLPTSLLKNIESDDYRDTPPLTFMRGYLRGYAKLVGIAGDEVIHAFNALSIEEQREFDHPLHHMVEKPVSTESIQYVRWTSYGLTALLAVLLISWWLGRTENSVPSLPKAFTAISVPTTSDLANTEAPAMNPPITTNANNTEATTTAATKLSNTAANKPTSRNSINSRAPASESRHSLGMDFGSTPPPATRG